jgi:hypothetical protein
VQNQSADEIRIERIVREQLARDGQHRRGRKRDASKITKILYRVLINDKLRRPALTVRELEVVGLKDADLRDHLQFLSQFPREMPFLNAERQQRRPRTAGAPPMTYRFEQLWILRDRLETHPHELSATICLKEVDDAPPQTATQVHDLYAPCSGLYAAWEHFSYLDAINLHNKIKPAGQDDITLRLIRNFQHPPFKY